MRRPLTFREMLRVYLACLTGLALMLNRDQFPAWALPELRGLGPIVREAHPWLGEQRSRSASFRGSGVSLLGKAHLVVGDSQAYYWPWSADIIGIPGIMADQMRERFLQETAKRPFHYELIVLWIGTAHFQRGCDVPSYVDGVAETVAAARQLGDHVIVLTGMPHEEWQAARYIKHNPDTPAQRDTLAQSAEAVRALRAHLPDVFVFDMGAFRAPLAAADLLDTYYDDAVHLSSTGWEALGDELATAGVYVSPD